MKQFYSIKCPVCKGKDEYCKICMGVGRVPRDQYIKVLQLNSKQTDEKTGQRYSKKEEEMILSGEYSLIELSEILHRSYRSVESKRKTLKKERRERDEKEGSQTSDSFGQS